MKILKIELQNINSLKSESPIVIDFENERFKDVGLYAITGSTGSGKTTILDAITIALYHQVPRFNKTNIKAGLKDVVSYGAYKATSRITFKNNNTVFEAFWSLRTHSKKGAKLSLPKEVVMLKNLDSGKILAEKKTEVEKEVIKITQLTYKQFLRSVMLAQGEFAAFLSAKPKDKGNLLEQITGEEIYKKIGESVLNHKSEETKILETIKAKINNEDILSKEDRETLTVELENLKKEKTIIDNDIKTSETIGLWYKNNRELEISKIQLDEDALTLKKDKEEKKGIIEAIDLNAKAEPFKELINDVIRIKKEIKQGTESQEKLKKDLLSNSQDIFEEEQKLDLIKHKLSKQENNINIWLPKLDEVTKLDTEIESLKLSEEKIIKEIQELQESITKKENYIAEKLVLRKSTDSQLADIQDFLSKNANIPEIEKNITSWNSELTIRKTNKESIEKESIVIKEKDKIQTEYRSEYKTVNKNLEGESIIVEKLKIDLESKSKLLKQKDLEQLLKNQKEKNYKKNELVELLSYSENYIHTINDKEKLLIDQHELENKKRNLLIKLHDFKSKIENAEISITDNEKILKLEQNIKRFEDERAKLIKDESCPLCGSKNHPFVEEYAQLEITKTEKELDNRKKILAKFKIDEKNLELETKEYSTLINSITKRLSNLNSSIIEFENKFNKIGSDHNIKNNNLIKASIEILINELNIIAKEIVDTQNIQKSKDKIEKEYRDKNEVLNSLKNTKATLKEKGINLRDELQQRNENLNQLLQKNNAIEKRLKNELFRFELVIPDAKNTNIFIQNIKNTISEFQLKNKELEKLKNTISQISNEIQNADNQLKDKNKEKIEKQIEKQNISKKISANEQLREAILPLNISILNKREELKIELELIKSKFEKLTKAIQTLKTIKATKSKEKENVEILIQKKSLTLKDKNIELKNYLEKSIFNSEHEILNALLSNEDKINFSKIKDELNTRTIELSTLTDKLQNDIAKQKETKHFEVSEEEIKIKLKDIKLKKEQVLTRIGEVNQKFDSDNTIRIRNSKIFIEIENQDKIVAKWSKLLILLGGSQHSFNTYVQRLTLQNLIHLANLHLFKLNKRYSLKMKENYKAKEELDFVLIDHFQTNDTRLVETSSGGEKFLISLSLALGLSDLASKNVNIGSLFIDEGFGTLDNKSLETVISTLETLHSQGKMIGIISHVENLKERIPVQIQIRKKSNGVSIVDFA